MLMRLIAGFLLLFTGSVGAVDTAEGVSGQPVAERTQPSLDIIEEGGDQLSNLTDADKKQLIEWIADKLRAKDPGEVLSTAPAPAPNTESVASIQITDCISEKRSWTECYKGFHGGHTTVYTTAYFSNPVVSADMVTDGLWLYKSVEFEKLKAALSTTAPTPSP